MENVTGITIITKLEGCQPVTRDYAIGDVFDGEMLKRSMTRTLAQCMHSAKNTGMSIDIRPIMDINAKRDVVWDGLSYEHQRALCALIIVRQKVAAIKLLRRETGYGVKEAKSMIDSNWMKEKIDSLIYLGGPNTAS